MKEKTQRQPQICKRNKVYHREKVDKPIDFKHLAQVSIYLLSSVTLGTISATCSAQFDDTPLNGDGGDVSQDNQASDQEYHSELPYSKSMKLIGTIRDFTDDHVDFENSIGGEDGIVQNVLAADKKPIYDGGDGTETTHGQKPFDQWYRDVEGVNQSSEFELVLTPGDDGVYTYDNQNFFPIDDQLLGNQGRKHNYHFTFELHTEFTYKGGELFTFTGDDDLWVFINGRLAIDIGGVHIPLSETVDMDAVKEVLGLEAGNTYPLDFFFAERHTTQSTFRIETTITDLRPVDVY